MPVKSKHYYGNVTLLGRELYTRELDGTWYIAMRPLVEALGLAWKPQYINIKSKFSDKATLTIFKTTSGRFRRYLALPQTELYKWALAININKIWSALASENLLNFIHELRQGVKADAEAVIIALRLKYLGEQYRYLPMCIDEKYFIEEMTKADSPLTPGLASMLFVLSIQKIKFQLDEHIRHIM